MTQQLNFSTDSHKLTLQEDREGNFVVELYNTEEGYVDVREFFENYEEAEKFYNQQKESLTDEL